MCRKKKFKFHTEKNWGCCPHCLYYPKWICNYYWHSQESGITAHNIPEPSQSKSYAPSKRTIRSKPMCLYGSYIITVCNISYLKVKINFLKHNISFGLQNTGNPVGLYIMHNTNNILSQTIIISVFLYLATWSMIIC